MKVNAAHPSRIHQSLALYQIHHLSDVSSQEPSWEEGQAGGMGCSKNPSCDDGAFLVVGAEQAEEKYGIYSMK